MLQTDLKGLPVFMMNHVLKRHPLALHYVRRHLTDQHADSHSPIVSDDEENTFATSKFGRKDSTFEEDVPAQHFIDEH